MLKFWKNSASLTSVSTGLDTVIEILGVALLNIPDNKASEITVEIFLELRELGRLRNFRACSCVGTVATLDSATWGFRCSAFEACSSIPSRRKLGLQCLNLGLSRGKLTGRLSSLRLECSNLCITISELLLKLPGLLTKCFLRCKFFPERVDKVIGSYIVIPYQLPGSLQFKPKDTYQL